MNSEIEKIIALYEKESVDFVIGPRNSIKLLNYNNQTLSIKKFKTPNFFIGFIYKFFRESKAKRSFLHAEQLLSKGIKTPQPIGYLENSNFFKLLDSYYVCNHINPDLIFRDLFYLPIEESKPVLKHFAHFCYEMHEKGIEFLDHSPGNTLIIKKDNGFDFYLVDLNRMKFHSKKMSLDVRMKNIARVAIAASYVEIISKEYAKVANLPEKEVFDSLLHSSQKFFKKSDKKKAIKKWLGLTKE